MPITLYPTAPLYNVIIIFDTILISRNEFVNAKDNEFNREPSRYFGTHRQCFAAFRLTWLAYSYTVGNVKIALSEKIALLVHRHVDVPCSLVVT